MTKVRGRRRFFYAAAISRHSKRGRGTGEGKRIPLFLVPISLRLSGPYCKGRIEKKKGNRTLLFDPAVHVIAQAIQKKKKKKEALPIPIFRSPVLLK